MLRLNTFVSRCLPVLKKSKRGQCLAVARLHTVHEESVVRVLLVACLAAVPARPKLTRYKNLVAVSKGARRSQL